MALLSSFSLTTNIVGVIILIIVAFMIVERVKNTASDIKSIAILVLGDIGRSPRMQRHALSLLNNLPNHYEIHFIGFINIKKKSGLISSLKSNSRIKYHNILSIKLKHNLFGNNKISFIIYAICRILSEIFYLIYILILSGSTIPSLTHIIVQNPPSIPILIIAKLTSIMRGTTFIIDWHNFGYTILSLKQKGIFVKIYKFIEKYVGRTANVHLTVTNEMKTFLIKEWRFNQNNIYVLRDRATEIFLNNKQDINSDKLLFDDIKKYFTVSDKNVFRSLTDLKQNDIWMISSTSWTPDEDLNMLLDENVLRNVDSKIDGMDNDKNPKSLSPRNKIILFITGKDEGNLKKKFEMKLNKINLKYISVIPLWLESYENYVNLLKWCNIGLCFHLSSSGLDLPMKVVDMYGVNIPVIAIDFDKNYMNKIMNISKNNKNIINTALHELIKHNQTGFVFKTSTELIKYILQMYNDINYNNSIKINQFKENINNGFRKFNWSDDWVQTMQKTNVFDTILIDNYNNENSTNNQQSKPSKTSIIE